MGFVVANVGFILIGGGRVVVIGGFELPLEVLALLIGQSVVDSVDGLGGSLGCNFAGAGEIGDGRYLGGGFLDGVDIG